MIPMATAAFSRSRVLQRVAVCGSVLQCVAACCSVWQRVAVCCTAAFSRFRIWYVYKIRQFVISVHFMEFYNLSIFMIPMQIDVSQRKFIYLNVYMNIGKFLENSYMYISAWTLENLVSFIGLFCKRDLRLENSRTRREWGRHRDHEHLKFYICIYLYEHICLHLYEHWKSNIGTFTYVFIYLDIGKLKVGKFTYVYIYMNMRKLKIRNFMIPMLIAVSFRYAVATVSRLL